MAAVFSNSEARRPASATEKPAACKARLTARPIPLPAPVTIAILPIPVTVPRLAPACRRRGVGVKEPVAWMYDEARENNMRWIVIALAASLAANVGFAARPVIFDTDMGNDIDDALTLAMLHALTARGECDLIGVTLTNANPAAVPYVRMINRFYGRGELPGGRRDQNPERRRHRSLHESGSRSRSRPSRRHGRAGARAAAPAAVPGA